MTGSPMQSSGSEPVAPINGLHIAYRVDGPAGALPLVLISGLSMQLVGWDDDMVALMVERGYRVVRFDNRDVGRSTHLDDAPIPNPAAAMFRGDTSSASYNLDDMADDVAGLIDHLELGSAHVLGISMGGMIAQTLAIRHPARVRSLTSIMSTTGAKGVGAPRPAGLAAMISRPPADREGIIEHTVRLIGVVGSPTLGIDTDAVRLRAGLAYDRAHDPMGVARQTVAIMASPERTAALGAVRVPALVVHGTEDPLIDVSGGRATAAAIPGAELLIIEGMGHDLPRAVWRQILDAVDTVTARGERAVAAS